MRHKLIGPWFSFTQCPLCIQEYVAVLIGLYKKPVAAPRCGEHKHSSRGHQKEGCGHALVSLHMGSLNGQMSIETATHSFL